MTIGQLIETIMTKLGTEIGSSMDCTAFNTSHEKIQVVSKHLSDNGYHSTGEEVLYNALTGEQIESSFFMGPTYYMRLKHMVKDKINYRAQGPRTLLTRQTNHGRANDGGLRVGEMERDGIIAHGCSHFLKESMMKRGDEYTIPICNHSGSIAVYDATHNNFHSPMIDGPIEFNTEDKDSITANKISKYAKEFSLVNVPYSFKLLMHELTTLNCHMRIITENNVDIKRQLIERTIEGGSNILSNTENSNDEDELEENGNGEKQNGNKNKDEPEVVFDKEERDNKPLSYYQNEREKMTTKLELWNRIDADDGSGFMFASFINKEDGESTEVLYSDQEYVKQLNGESPDIYPLGWSNSVLRDNNIPQEYMAEALKINQDLDNNWNRIIQK